MSNNVESSDDRTHVQEASNYSYTERVFRRLDALFSHSLIFGWILLSLDIPVAALLQIFMPKDCLPPWISLNILFIAIGSFGLYLICQNFLWLMLREKILKDLNLQGFKGFLLAVGLVIALCVLPVMMMILMALFQGGGRY